MTINLEIEKLNEILTEQELALIKKFTINNGLRAAYLNICDYGNPAGRLTPVMKSKLANLLKLLNQRNFSAFNLNYEYLSTLSQFGVKLDNFEDVMQTGKALDIRGGLKDQVQLQLGKRGWTGPIDDWLKNLEVVMGMFKPTNTAKGLSRDKKEFLTMQEKGIREAVEFYKKKGLKTADRVIASLKYILDKSEEIYGHPDSAYEKLEKWLKYKHSVNDWEIRYVDIPVQILGHYCALDCHYTTQLRAKYEAVLKEKDLVHAAEVYNRQMRFANKLEVTGFKWDDDKAEEYKEQYVSGAIDALRKFLLLNRTKHILEINSIQEIEIMSATTMEVLKKYFNPDSTAPANTVLLSKILTTDKLRMAMMFSHLNEEFQQLDNTVEADCPLLYKLMLSFTKDNLPPNYVTLVIRAITNANVSGTLTLPEKGLLGKYSVYQLPDATSETVESIANGAKKYLAVNLDKEDTWTEEYKLVYYYKLFKKISKSISAFIDGKNGRKAVVVVKKEKVNGHYPRVGEYRRLNDDDLDIEYIRSLLSTKSALEITL